MLKNEVEQITSIFIEQYGLALSADAGREERGEYIDFRPVETEIHPNESFVIRVIIGWHSIEAEFRPGKFSADLLREMAKADSNKKEVFKSLADAISGEGVMVKMTLNDSIVNPSAPEKWPSEWKNLYISLKHSPIETSGIYDVLKWGGRLLSMVVTLLPLAGIEEEDEKEIDILNYPEGAKSEVTVNRYERSRKNRATCIAVHGYICKVCGFDFGESYGLYGRGFIHVHHIVPLSRLGEGYLLNPVKDLIPICPNCHAMIHRRETPLSIDDLRQILGDIIERDTKT